MVFSYVLSSRGGYRVLELSRRVSIGDRYLRIIQEEYMVEEMGEDWVSQGMCQVRGEEDREQTLVEYLYFLGVLRQRC